MYKFAYFVGKMIHKPGARRQNAHMVSGKMLPFAYRNFLGQIAHRHFAPLAKCNLCFV
jgi:hypothetical protein